MTGPASTPLVYTITIADPFVQLADIHVEIPTDGRVRFELMMPIWSPGFYRVEDYAEQVQALTAMTPDGALLLVERTAAQRWRIHNPAGDPQIRLTYRLCCTSATVTTNWVGAEFAIFNGPATFITLADGLERPHEVVVALPPHWSQVFTGLPRGATAHHLIAPNFDTLVDAPIMLGDATVHTFTVDGRRHDLVAVGDRRDWDGARMAHDLERVVREHVRLWRGLPYHDYTFLFVCREGGGGLEHANSTLVTAQPTRLATAEGYDALLSLVSHEFFHAFNVKRLRPRELGPFDYEQPPHTRSLWVAEGLTCYYTDLLLCRAGLRSRTWLLGRLSEQIALLQTTPGRLQQTLEQSSLDVWANSFSGLTPNENSVSYYIKGHIVGWLLDAQIRQATGGDASLDNLMRLAITRYGGASGFTPDEFRALVEQFGDAPLGSWLEQATASTNELDYAPALAWFGLCFAVDEAQPTWRIDIDQAAGEEQQRRLASWAVGDQHAAAEPIYTFP